jgi:predicted  nucleic acid-binding Zn-ribbon protein
MIALVSSAMVPVAAAALRGLAAGLAVAGGIAALRLRHVVAQKAAWTLVLAGAMLMPLTSPWLARQNWLPAWLPSPASAASRIAEQSRAWLESIRARREEPVPAAVAAPVRETSESSDSDRASSASVSITSRPVGIFVEHASAPEELVGPLGPQYPPRAIEAYAARIPSPILTAAEEAIWALYLVVTIALLGRLFYGLSAAMRLWQSAWPIQLAETSIPVRVHGEITSPITIGSGILLPADYAEWNSDKLNIVLAHESSHVRQRDFYLQLAAGLYTAIFWFSPLGWWLKRKLSNLGEAISDHAAVAYASSRTSYAQILLEFASQPYTTHFETRLGVAMARKERISERIEWLLNETRFRQAFAGGRSRIFAAAVLAPLAVFAATALVRVEAKAQTPAPQQVNPAPATQPVPAQAPADAAQSAQTTAATGVSHPDDSTITIAPVAPAAVIAPDALPAPAPAVVTVPIPPVPQISPDVHVSVGDIHPDISVTTDAYSNVDTTSYGRGYSYAYGNSGQDKVDSYAVITKNGQHVRFSGDYSNSVMDKARRQANGDFLWFTRDGKQYIVDDPDTLNRIHSIYQPMEQLGEQMKAESKQQEMDAKASKAEIDREMAASNFSQAELDKETADMRAREPEFRKQMADLSAQMAKMQMPKIAPIDQKQLDDLKRQVAQLQATQPDFSEKLSELINKMVNLQVPQMNAVDQEKLAELDAKIGEVSKKFADDQTRIAVKNSVYAKTYSKQYADVYRKMGDKMGKMGGQMGQMAGEADKQMRSIIDESMKNGKAKPVQ